MNPTKKVSKIYANISPSKQRNLSFLQMANQGLLSRRLRVTSFRELDRRKKLFHRLARTQISFPLWRTVFPLGLRWILSSVFVRRCAQWVEWSTVKRTSFMYNKLRLGIHVSSRHHLSTTHPPLSLSLVLLRPDEDPIRREEAVRSRCEEAL